MDLTINYILLHITGQYINCYTWTYVVVVRLASVAKRITDSTSKPHSLGGGVLILEGVASLISGARPFGVGVFTPERLLQLVEKSVVKLVQTRFGAVLWRRRRGALDGTLQAALGGSGARPGVLSRHVRRDTAMGRRRDHVVWSRRSRQAWSFGFTLRHFSRTTRSRVRALGDSSRTIGLVDVPIVLYNWHHEGHGWGFGFLVFEEHQTHCNFCAWWQSLSHVLL